MKLLPVSGPWITDREVAYAAEAARTGWYDTAHVFPQRFEQAFAAYLDVRFAVSLPHATAGLHLALAALGVGPGDEVILPDVTWIASAAPVSYVGATPVFVDIDPSTWCLDPQAFKQAITPRTKAVIPVDLYGGMPDWDAVRAVAHHHNVAVIEDAAEAIGSEWKGRKAGSLGDVGVFSFHGSKTLTTGEGGLLATNREDIYQRVMVLRDHGRPPGDRLFFNAEVAFKYKMSALQAAVGLAQIERVEELVARKREIFGWYRDRLAGVPALTLNAEPAGTLNSYWMTTVLIDDGTGREKADYMALLARHGIDSRPFFNPLSSLPAYAESPASRGAPGRNPVGYRVSCRGLNLPSGLLLTKNEVTKVCDALLSMVPAG